MYSCFFSVIFNPNWSSDRMKLIDIYFCSIYCLRSYLSVYFRFSFGYNARIAPSLKSQIYSKPIEPKQINSNDRFGFNAAAKIRLFFYMCKQNRIKMKIY